MLIRMVEVVEVREIGGPLNLGRHLKVKLASPVSDGRRVHMEIDKPLNDAMQFQPLEEMVLVLIPAKSLLAIVAKALADPEP